MPVDVAEAPTRPGDSDGLFADDGDPEFRDLPVFPGAAPAFSDEVTASVPAASGAEDTALDDLVNAPPRGGRRSRVREPQPA